MMYEALVARVRYHILKANFMGLREAESTLLLGEAADAIEELQKAIMRLEEASGILDELPTVDQSTPCDTCFHRGDVDFDYCHICNNETNMYKPNL